MFVYHGSDHIFRTLKIVKANQRLSSADNEGGGIYFSTDIEIARSYVR